MKFRDHHLSLILQKFEQQKLPLDVFLNHYFRAHHALGSKDRRFISETIYEKFRSMPFPQPLNDILVQTYGPEKTTHLHEICLSRAPTTVRINPLKTTRDAFLSKWSNGRPTSRSLWGISFQERINFSALPEFQEGHFEVQDEASQLIAFLVAAKPGDHVIDFCAGAGGKTLAFAPQMQGRGQVYLHDIRPLALQQARKRLNRAGIQNIQFKLPPKLSADWIIVDVPCTGTGTLRRNPDLKERFSLEALTRLIQEQQTIFQEALRYLKPSGKIVYSTCSILPQENEDQITFFKKTYSLKVEQTFHSLPKPGGMDGFFGAILSHI
jgi:16S rRNA (cytosine967-C5)-methyltransferase